MHYFVRSQTAAGSVHQVIVTSYAQAVNVAHCMRRLPGAVVRIFNERSECLNAAATVQVKRP